MHGYMCVFMCACVCVITCVSVCKNVYVPVFVYKCMNVLISIVREQKDKRRNQSGKTLSRRLS